MHLWIFMFVVFLICVAFTWNEGSWNNIVTFLMALFAGIFATNYYGIMARYLTFTSGALVEYTKGGNYLWDVFCFWFIFGLTFAILRAIGDTLSKHKLRFKKPVEIAANIIMSTSIGVLMVTLMLFATHIAPLSRHPLGGSFQVTPTQHGPSRVWMILADYWSFGSLSNLFGVERFGSSQDFIERHYWRRRTLEAQEGFTVEMETPYSVIPSKAAETP